MDAIQNAFKGVGGNSSIYSLKMSEFFSLVKVLYIIFILLYNLCCCFKLLGVKQCLVTIQEEAVKVHDLLADGINAGTLQVQVFINLKL